MTDSASLHGGTGASRDAARAAKSVLASRLSGDTRVNGIGITRQEASYAVKVNVLAEDDAPEVPAEVDGVPVQVVVVGRVTAGG